MLCVHVMTPYLIILLNSLEESIKNRWTGGEHLGQTTGQGEKKHFKGRKYILAYLLFHIDHVLYLKTHFNTSFSLLG